MPFLQKEIVMIYSRGVLQPSGIRRFGNGLSLLSPLRPVLKETLKVNDYDAFMKRIALLCFISLVVGLLISAPRGLSQNSAQSDLS